MTGIIVVCMLHYNTAIFGINIVRRDYIVESQVACNALAEKSGRWFAGTGSTMTYDMSSASDQKQLIIRCGPEARGCIINP